MTQFRSFIVAVWLAPIVWALGVTMPGAQELSLRGVDGRDVRAMIIGIDAYQNVRPLKGAAADARDIERVLRRMGVVDVTAMIDGQATRAAVLREMDQLTQRIKPGDLVVLSIAGHGAQEPERVKGSQPDGMDNVFLLPGFEVSAAGSQQRVLGQEFNFFIKQFESKGARVLFVADTCHGGGMTREVDPRSAEMSFRQVAQYTLAVDQLQPVGTNADARLTELDFERTAFLAAVDRKTKAPEVRIPGIQGLRGALSYAVARAFEGQADTNHDGKVTLQELFTQVRGVVYQLSNQRQTPVMLASPSRAIETEVAFTYGTRGAPPLAVPPAAPSLASAAPPQRPLSTIRIASLDPQVSPLSELERRDAPFEVIGSVDGADLAWDPKSGDVLSGGDVIAYRVAKNDLPSVIDRSTAVLGIKGLAAKSVQGIKVGPDDKLHRDRSKVVVDITGVAGRALILFNIAGDGTVQALYPVGNDAPLLKDRDYRLPVLVAAPHGADQIVAITSEQRMLALEQALKQLHGRRSSVQIMRMVERYAPSDARIGTVGIFTAP